MDSGVLLMVVAVVIVVTGLLGSVTERRLGRLDRRLACVERKLDAVLDHLGVATSEPGLEQVEAFLREGKKIQAIKAYRERTGADLREAKDAVERLAGR